MENMATKKKEISSTNKKVSKKVKSTSGGKTSIKKTGKVPSESKTSKKESQNIMKSKKYIAFVVILIIAGILYLLRGQYLAAMVNGIPITRFTVLQKLEDQSGQQILDQLVSESLIKQEARQLNVNVRESDIDAEIAEIQENIEKQGQNLQDLLAFQGMTMEDLRGRIDTQLTLEKLLEDRVTIEQSEVDDFIKQSANSLPEDMSTEEIEELARDQLVQSKLQSEIQKYLQELKDSADIQYFGNYQPSATE